jgi:multidrug transporter EmrE-like cation transporter
MIVVVHVFVCILLAVESVVASLTFKVWSSMTIIVHVILGFLLARELTSTTLACPVTDGIHVLICGMPGSERALACFAFHHCDDTMKGE